MSRSSKRAVPRAPATAGLDRLWAPWRMEYIDRAAIRPTAKAARPGRREDEHDDAGECLFCRVGRSRSERRDLVLLRRGEALLMLNRFPYNPAHLMVAVRRHVPRLADLTALEREDLLALGAVAERALETEYRPHGINLGINLGRVAGAGFPGHLHLHLVPRWNGDTNFMPVIGQTRVLPESLERTWTRLKRVLDRATSARPAGAGSARRPRRG